MTKTLVRSSLIGGALAVAILVAAEPATSQRVTMAPPTYAMAVTGGTSVTNVSGDAGQAAVVEGPAGHVLTMAEFGELRDRPCGVNGMFSRWELEGSDVENVIPVRRESGACQNSLQSVAANSGSAISAVRICQRRQNDRLKGVEIRSRTLSPNGMQPGVQRKFDRPNCNEWQAWVECPANTVAVAMVAHYNDAAATGLALRCRGVTWTQQPRARSTTGSFNAPSGLTVVSNVTDSNPVSGTAASQQVLSAPEPHMGLTRIRYGERNDRPCYLEATFWTDNGGTQTSRSATFNRCQGNHRSVRTVEIQNNTSNVQMVSSIEACQRRSNDRLKGIRLRGSRVDASGASPDPAINASDERTNCNEWSGFSHCFQGQVAVGVRVHYRPSDNNPAEIVGLGLQCAEATRR